MHHRGAWKNRKAVAAMATTHISLAEEREARERMILGDNPSMLFASAKHPEVRVTFELDDGHEIKGVFVAPHEDLKGKVPRKGLLVALRVYIAEYAFRDYYRRHVALESGVLPDAISGIGYDPDSGYLIFLDQHLRHDSRHPARKVVNAEISLDVDS